MTLEGGGGGGWNAISYQIIDPFRYFAPKKIKYPISHHLDNHISDSKVPPFHLPTGDADIRTEHTEIPVLNSSKYMSNMLFFEGADVIEYPINSHFDIHICIYYVFK